MPGDDFVCHPMAVGAVAAMDTGVFFQQDVPVLGYFAYKTVLGVRGEDTGGGEPDCCPYFFHHVWVERVELRLKKERGIPAGKPLSVERRICLADDEFPDCCSLVGGNPYKVHS